MSEPDLDDFHDERVALRVARHRIHALEKELAELNERFGNILATRTEQADKIMTHQNALKEAEGMLRAFRKSMDSELPFPSKEKLSGIIATINSVLGESK